jgi:hypothetical protein
MPATAVPSRWHHASLVSDAVAERLPVRPLTAGVLSVHRTAINLVLPDGDLVVLGLRELGALPNGVLLTDDVDLRSAGVRPGHEATLTADRIEIGPRAFQVDLSSAARWSATMPAASPDAAPRWRERARSVRAGARRLVAGSSAPGAGLAPLLDPPFERMSAVAARARAALDQVEAAITESDLERLPAVARPLLGLGPGLTPSGDDALVGLAAALHALDHPDRRFLRPLAAEAADRTTRVASDLLRHAGEGRFTQRLHDLLDALLGEHDAAIQPALERAGAWGATSGLDTLVGVLLGLDVASSPAAVAAAGSRP